MDPQWPYLLARHQQQDISHLWSAHSCILPPLSKGVCNPFKKKKNHHPTTTEQGVTIPQCYSDWGNNAWCYLSDQWHSTNSKSLTDSTLWIHTQDSVHWIHSPQFNLLHYLITNSQPVGNTRWVPPCNAVMWPNCISASMVLIWPLIKCQHRTLLLYQPFPCLTLSSWMRTSPACLPSIAFVLMWPDPFLHTQNLLGTALAITYKKGVSSPSVPIWFEGVSLDIDNLTSDVITKSPLWPSLSTPLEPTTPSLVTPAPSSIPEPKQDPAPPQLHWSERVACPSWKKEAADKQREKDEKEKTDWKAQWDAHKAQLLDLPPIEELELLESTEIGNVAKLAYVAVHRGDITNSFKQAV